MELSSSIKHSQVSIPNGQALSNSAFGLTCELNCEELILLCCKCGFPRKAGKCSFLHLPAQANCQGLPRTLLAGTSEDTAYLQRHGHSCLELKLLLYIAVIMSRSIVCSCDRWKARHDGQVETECTCRSAEPHLAARLKSPDEALKQNLQQKQVPY